MYVYMNVYVYVCMLRTCVYVCYIHNTAYLYMYISDIWLVIHNNSVSLMTGLQDRYIGQLGCGKKEAQESIL